MTHPHPAAGVYTPSGRAVPLARDGEWLDHLLFKMASSWLLFPQDFAVHGSIETKELSAQSCSACPTLIPLHGF